MATHDYVIANGTGSAVRSDLNNALAAIVSNNSGTSEPGTTYAYQWWADTTANVLKIRNSANNAWITLRELDGTMLIEDGSGANPGLAFASDTNSGIFGGSDVVGFSTGGTQRFKLTSTEAVVNEVSNDYDFRVESNSNTHMLFVNGGNDRVGVNESSPITTLHVNAGTTDLAAIVESSDANVFFAFKDGNSSGNQQVQIGAVTNDLVAYSGGSESLRVDSDGRLFVGGTSEAHSGTNVQIQDTASPVLTFARDDASISEGNGIGQIDFYGNDGGSFQSCAHIIAQAEGAHANNDKPTRLIFGTTANGESSPTTRLIIKESGRVGINDTNPDGNFHVGTNGNSDGTDVDVFIGGNAANTRQFRILKKIQTDDRGVEFHAATGSSTEEFRFYSNSSTETLRLSASGDLRIAMDNFADAAVFENSHNGGVVIKQTNDIKLQVARVNGTPMAVNRIDSDGNLVNFRQEGTQEGTISVSGSTVTYGGGHLARWSQLEGGAERTEILRGSVLSNLDEMCEWAHPAQDAIAAQDAVLYTEEDELPEGVDVGEVKTPAVEARPAVDAYTESNEQLNRMKISDVEGDVNVAGVFVRWDDDDDEFTNDFYCAMTGDFVIRIAQGTTVARGDLLMSAGDGTAKPQDDDIVRSKTIAKVTSTTVSTTYSDGSYCVPCVLMAC